ncbi:MAG: DUF1365 family protein [Mycobacterium sp.]|nr:DUF1365 family protein [Mycobacterium sp.]
MTIVETATLYPIRVTHLHRSPVQHYAEHRSYNWYVDVDDLPRLPRWARPFARFEAADHFDGIPGDTLRQRVDAFLAGHGVFIPGGRVTALLMPRVLGRAFNPLSLFWCHDAAGAVRCVVAEVQSIDGARRAFLLPAAEEAPTAVAEGLTGAPFAGDDGYFLVRVPRPGDDLDIAISLHRNNHAALVATWRGSRRRAGLGRVLLMQVSHPLAPHVAHLSLWFQGLVLQWRGLPAAPRPARTERVARRSVQPAAGWGAKTHSWATS